ncbi:hypothetical protein A5760_23025 [Mycobacterium colombiense]|uniref:NmrA-like domain-containing protein n=1 Tax=Mycobacterium colombiense TaxID=339268 RepID=A0A1A0W0U4_9MYCO|nr:hypothetical protein [Mycobacterium colombiense]OBB89118.1 hypothetical protein A5760_23025 [Mycobacterium colombiense]
MRTKVNTVIGATGAQDLRLRAITRNPDSAKARAMAAQGAEVAADIADVDRLGPFPPAQMPGSHEVVFSTPIGLINRMIAVGRD